MGPLDLRQQEYVQHQQELLHEAEQRRMVVHGAYERPHHHVVRHTVSRVGSLLVLLGTKLERVEPA